jgi:hypothetical protein
MTVINLADFGFKSLETTGSIDAGSNRLHVESSAGFKVGDPIIIAVGGEAGEGLRGTQGVGGVWDTSKAPWAGPDSYYWGADAPKALTARVVAIDPDGTSLILDRSAANSSAGASVYFDNKPSWDAAMKSSSASGVTVEIPPGDFAASGTLLIQGKTGWTIEGAGKDATRIFAAPGANANTIYVSQSESVALRNFELDGNVRMNGYGFDEKSWAPGGILFTLSNNGLVEDVTVRDVFSNAVQSQYSSNVWAVRVDAHSTEGHAQYTQWQFQWDNSTGGGTIDCSVESPILIEGFNSFGSTGTSHIRPLMINATMAANSSGNFQYIDPTIIIRANSWVDDRSFHHNKPLIDINGNLSSSSSLTQSGGLIKNPTLIQEGYINSNNDILKGITISQYNHGVVVEGGQYIAPDYVAGNKTSLGPVGLWSDGINTKVDGFGVIGKGVMGNIVVMNGTVENSFANAIIVKSGQALGNGIPQALTVTLSSTGRSSDGGGAYTFQIKRSGETTHALDVNYEVSGSGINPAGPSMFLGGSIPSGTVHFTAGETSKTIIVLTDGPAVRGAEQQFTLSLATATPGAYVLNDGVDAWIPGDAAPSGNAVVVGAAVVGQQLTLDTSHLSDSDGLGAFHIQWQSSADGHVWWNTASSSTAHQLTAADQGHMLRAVVTYVDGKGLTESVTTASTGVITPPTLPDTVTGSALAWISNGGASSANLSRGENSTAVATALATDPDGGTLTYSIAGGADATKFTIDPVTGTVSFVSAPDFEAPSDAGHNNVYDVIVRATDGVRYVDQALAVSISNSNDSAPVMVSFGGVANASMAIAENTKAVTTLHAVDADGTTPTYAITGGTDAAKFIINASTGALSFVTAPDFEAPKDANHDNIYNVVVRATDGLHFSDQALAVAVVNVNDTTVVEPSKGGGIGDLLWRSSDGHLKGLTGRDYGGVGNDWKVQQTADFGGDGRADILWRNDNGAVNIWTSNGSDFKGREYGVIGNEWEIQKTADFDGDGRADILWRHDNGAVNVWTSTGSNFSGHDYAVIGGDWKVQEAADFNGDGRADILWRNDNGAVNIWTSTGSGFSGQDYGGIGNDWKVQKAADFDGDGRADILWRNDNGAVNIWTSTGSSFAGRDHAGVGTEWNVQGATDTTGDGRADIIWRQDGGALNVWESTGSSFSGHDYGVVDPSWHLVG